MRMLWLILAFVHVQLFADDRVYLSHKVLTVSISKVPNACNLIALQYSVMTSNDISIPMGITGLNGEPFLYSVLKLRNGENFTGMNLPIIQDYGTEKMEDVLLYAKDSPLQAIVNLGDYFSLIEGEYYLSYSFVWGLREKDEAVISDIAASERYYVKVDRMGCIEILH